MTRPETGGRRWAVPGYCLILTIAVIGPLLAPGYLLLRDAVSTPRSFLSDTALGLGGTAPRAVPQDFAVAVASAVLDGGVVVKALLGLALLLACGGAARLAAQVMGAAGLAGQFVAATLAVWNPYVAERILQGQWSLLLGYGCLPWVAAAVLRLRTAGDARAGDWAALMFWTALAGLTPTGLILAAIVALACVAAPGGGVGRPRCAAAVAGIAVLAALPWLAASALGGALSTPQSSGLAPFAARAEPGLGTLGSLAGLGGIWNAEAVPPTRATAFAVAATAVLLAVVAAGLPAALRRPTARPLLVLALTAVLLPAVMATGPGLAGLAAVVEGVPGLAVLRDGQKWVALAMPGYCLAGAGAVLAARRWARPAGAAALCCAALIAVLPDLAWGVWGRVVPVHYPPGWAAAAAVVNSDPGIVAVLPAEAIRRFDWAGPAPVLDPLPRWVRAEVLSTGDVVVSGNTDSGRTVTGEGVRARAVQALLLAGADPAALRGAGVAWVVVEHRTPGTAGSAGRTLAELPAAYRDADISVYRTGGVSSPARPERRIAVLLAHLLWAGMLTGGAAVAAVQSLRRPCRRS